MVLQDKIKRRYSADMGKAYHDTKRFIPDRAYPWVARLRAEKIAPYVSENDTVLEYGVGTGWNVAELKCKRRLGYDLSEHLAPVLDSHGVEFLKDITTVADGSIDAVICHHVLEHTSNPPEVLEQIKRMLCRDGKLLLFVPYEKERRYRCYNPQEPNHHLYSWNVQTLGNLVEDIGFKVVQAWVGRFGYDRFAAVWAARLCLGEIGYRFIRGLAHLLKPAFEVRIVASIGDRG
jgi:SAM-dependent methyltransferase